MVEKAIQKQLFLNKERLNFNNFKEKKIKTLG